MTDLSAAALPVSVLKPLPMPTTTASTTGANETATRARIAKSGKDYEAAFLNIMLGQMMSGVKATTFGGGEGEEAFKSFLTDAMAKSIVKHGGIGMAKLVSADMLKLQGLSATPTTAAPAAKPPAATAPVLDIAA